MSIPDCDPPRTKTYRDNDKPKDDGPVIVKNGPNFAEMWFQQKCEFCETIFKYQEKHLKSERSTSQPNHLRCPNYPNCSGIIFHNRIYRIEEK